MRPPRFRFKVRSMTVVVAVVGLTIAAVELSRRRQAFAQAMASYHHDRFDDVMFAPSTLLNRRPWIQHADYHSKMESKWMVAARRPWLPVEPDPPAPPE